jgi:hypothetical protein
MLHFYSKLLHFRSILLHFRSNLHYFRLFSVYFFCRYLALTWAVGASYLRGPPDVDWGLCVFFFFFEKKNTSFFLN